ncbi:MAG TPA: hypothetical protein VLI71_07090 [Gammaproteobacteria bacterium]|nr:hypothetical protein [Gammaproteobacteria bacterium]
MANRIEFFGRRDSLWGGETLKCNGLSRLAGRRLGIKRNDKFRIERGPKQMFTLIPDPKNRGTWKESHNKSNPVKVSPRKHTPTRFKRAYPMMVTTKKDAEPQLLFLVELGNGGIAITSSATAPLHASRRDHDYASVER